MGKYWIGDKRTPAGVEHEYKRYQSSKKAKRDRAARNTARRRAERAGLVKHGDSEHEIDHKDSVATHNSKSNLRVVSRTFNRSRKENSRRRGSRRRKESWGL